MYKTAYEKVLAREIAGRMYKQALWCPTYRSAPAFYPPLY